MKKEPEEAKAVTSMFLVTINPNKKFLDLNTPEAKEMEDNLTRLGEFLLTEESIKMSLMFFNKPDKKTKNIVNWDRDEHLSRIVSISEDRTGNIEVGDKFHRMHIHIEFKIKHRTFLQLHKLYYEKAAEKFTGVPMKSIHVNIRGRTQQAGYREYLAVGAPEDAKHFFDTASSHLQ